MDVSYASRHISAARASEIAEVFKQIRKTGPLTPARVRDHAKNPRSPLHRYFEWDNDKAGDAHRLEQARDLIASVRIRITSDPNQKPKTFRAYVRVVTKKGPDYVETLGAMSNADHRSQVIAQALSELQAFERKYRDLTELAEVFTALAKVRRRKAAA